MGRKLSKTHVVEAFEILLSHELLFFQNLMFCAEWESATLFITIQANNCYAALKLAKAASKNATIVHNQAC